MGRLRIISGYRRTNIHVYPQLINRAVSVRLELINELLGMDYATFNILRLFIMLKCIFCYPF